MPRPAPTTLLRDDVYDRIKRSVLTCELAPGAEMREQELAESFGVSKSPVRDALHRLQTEGLIEVLPRKGYRVKTISLEDALELYEMRIILECACVERAARASSKSDLNALDVYRRGPDTHSQREWIDYNREFHVAIATICGNNRLLGAAKDVIFAFDRLTSASVSQLQNVTTKGLPAFDEMDREHGEIIDALQARDASTAMAIMQLHLQKSRTRFLEGYNSPIRQNLNEAARRRESAKSEKAGR